MNKLAIIGGSGLYNIDGIKDEKWLNIDTPWGKPSDQILEAKVYSIKISVTNSINKGPYLLTTILNDKNNTKDEAITEIYI